MEKIYSANVMAIFCNDTNFPTLAHGGMWLSKNIFQLSLNSIKRESLSATKIDPAQQRCQRNTEYKKKIMHNLFTM